MKLALVVNTRNVTAEVEPRTHLADLVRDRLDLTGTHLGCEQGVCGACTLLVDGEPIRSCITLAAACDGARIITIEGLDEDEVAAELRAAFTREHALQCGYCTPGMLIAARDLVLRLSEADEKAIRLGLSGNLCRCTGYVGIVRAVRAVIADRRDRGIAPLAGRDRLGPVGAGHGAIATVAAPDHPADAAAPVVIRDFIPARRLEEGFDLPLPPAAVFASFADPVRLAACLPGVRLTVGTDPDHLQGEFRVGIGPISAGFRGAARVERDEATLSGRIVGSGDDAGSRSTTQGEVRWRLLPRNGGTRVELSIGYTLIGTLAQVAREGLVRNFAARLVAEFARNLRRELTGAPPPRSWLSRARAAFRALLGQR